jgi:hypothetical protein
MPQMSNFNKPVETNRDRDFSIVKMSAFEMSTSRVSMKISTKIEISEHFRVIETDYEVSRCHFLSVEISVFEMSRSIVSIESMSRQIETPRPKF